MRFQVNTPSKQAFEMHVEPGTTILQLKAELAEKEGLPVPEDRSGTVGIP